MATPRRSSQQQQPNSLLSSPPRGSLRPGTPPGSPAGATDDATPLSHGDRIDSTADGEATPASPTTTSPAPALSSSSSSSNTSSSASSPTTTEGSGTSAGSTPDSGSSDQGSSGSSGSANGAFRELFEACRNGDVSRVKKLVDAVNVNAKDMAGRKSTPLHFAAGNQNHITNVFSDWLTAVKGCTKIIKVGGIKK